MQEPDNAQTRRPRRGHDRVRQRSLRRRPARRRRHARRPAAQGPAAEPAQRPRRHPRDARELSRPRRRRARPPRTQGRSRSSQRPRPDADRRRRVQGFHARDRGAAGTRRGRRRRIARWPHGADDRRDVQSRRTGGVSDRAWREPRSARRERLFRPRCRREDGRARHCRAARRGDRGALAARPASERPRQAACEHVNKHAPTTLTYQSAPVRRRRSDPNRRPGNMELL